MSPVHPAGVRVLKADTAESFADAVRQAVQLLREGGVVALPTETVYGLAANAFDAAAVERVFRIKGRPAHNPIIVHVASLDLAKECVATWPAAADALASRFWPGPLTLVMPRSKRIPDIVTAGGGTVGIRWPRHPLVQAVIAACGFPLAAPSANRSAEISPSCAEHVVNSLGPRVDLVVDGGPCEVGIESTVLDLTVTPPKVLRPGTLDPELIKVTGGTAATQTSQAAETGETLRSPGMMERHYAPKARLRVLAWENEAELLREMDRQGQEIRSVHVLSYRVHPHDPRWGRVIAMPDSPQAYARSLYRALHQCDDEAAEVIAVEQPPEALDWGGVLDRLRRASR